MTIFELNTRALVVISMLVALPLATLAQNGPALRPLPPKAGHVIGRVVDMQGRPMANIEITVVGTISGALVFEPDLDPRSGYYELEVPDDLYRVHASFNQATNDRRPQTTQCLLNSLNEFVPLDGKGPNTRSGSKKGIVKDFVYVPKGC
jgi:hypothetical protein